MHNVYFSSSEHMRRIKDSSINMVVTSPPYWNLKNYEVNNQIGYRETYDVYLKRLNKVWLETSRVLTRDGWAVVNINCRSVNKKTYLIPSDVIKQFEEINIHLRDILYWHKSSGIPRKNNLGDHFEYFLIFSKSNKPKVNQFDYFDYKYDRKKKNVVNIWNINKKFGSVGKKYMVHPAIFPTEFITRLLLIFSKKNDYILDPFLGSGTTLLACEQTHRNGIGYELNKKYLPLIKQRIEDSHLSLDRFVFHR